MVLKRPFKCSLYCLFGWLVSQRPHQQLGYLADRSQDRRLTILRAATHETEWGDHEHQYEYTHPLARAVQLTVFQLIINGNKFVTFNRTNRLITAVISDPLHSL